MTYRKTISIISSLNLLAVAGIISIVIAAFFVQFILNELPCPLCLLQRLGLLSIAFGFLLNIRYGIHPLNYSLSLLSSIVTAFIAMRQIALHINDIHGYGSPFLGIHMYTWVFLICIITIFYVIVILSFKSQYENISINSRTFISKCGEMMFYILMLVIAVNIFFIILECGFTQCPEDPEHYKIML